MRMTPENGEMFRARVYLTGTAVGLLWITSLAFARFVVNSVLGVPGIGDVWSSVEMALNVSRTQGETYSNCVHAATQQCAWSLEKQTKVELSRADRVAENNTAKLNTLDQLTTSCQKDRRDVYMYVSNLQKSRSKTLADMMRTGMEGNPQCSALQSVVDRETALAESSQVADSFMQKSNSQTEETVSIMEARVSYDREYLRKKSHNVILPLRQEVEASTTTMLRTLHALEQKAQKAFQCLSDDRTGCHAGEALQDKVNALMDQAVAVHEKALASYAQLEERAAWIKAKVTRFQEEYESFKDRIALKLVLFVVDPPSIDAEELFWNALKDRLPQPPMEELENRLEEKQREISELVQKVNNEYNAQVANYVEEQENSSSNSKTIQLDLLQDFFSDYAPPAGARLEDVERSQMELRKSSSEFVVEVLGKLKHFGSFDQALGSFNSSTPEVPNMSGFQDSVEEGAAEITDWLNPKSWSFFSYEGFSAQRFVSLWEGLSNSVLLVDILFRIARTLHIIRKYMDLSRVLTPAVDVRACNNAAEEKSKTRMNPQQRAFYLLFHPVTKLAVGALFLWIILSAFLALYLPFLEKYVEGCLHTGVDGEGTFLSNNAHTILMQNASQAGNRASIDSISAANKWTLETCNELRESTRRNLFQQLEQHASLRQHFRAAAYDVETLQICTSLEQENFFLSGVFQRSTCRDPVAEISEPDTGAVFNCSVLLPCQVTCPGPNERIIQFWSWNASCQVESYVHLSIFAALCSGSLFVLMNVSRVLLVKGLRFLLWESLSQGKYTYLADATLDIRLESLEQVDLRAVQVHLEIERVLRGFSRRGKGYMLASFLCLLPPFILLPHATSFIFTNPI